MDETTFYIDAMGDIRCRECVPRDENDEPKFDPIPRAEVQELGDLLVPFGRDVVCQCERLRWDATAQTATITPSIGCNICGEALADAEPHVCA